MVEINNQTSFRVDKKFYTGVAKKVLKGENKERQKISLAFVDKEEIKNLNKKFRKKNKPTDVLSFRLDGSFGGKKQKLLGEIVICPEVVKENSEKYKEQFRQEMAKVFVHGILHLLGYDHEKSKRAELLMDEKQDFYLDKIFKK